MNPPVASRNCWFAVALLAGGLVLGVLIGLGMVPTALGTGAGFVVVTASGIIREVCPPSWFQWTQNAEARRMVEEVIAKVTASHPELQGEISSLVEDALRNL